jgi:hypothetical protein
MDSSRDFPSIHVINFVSSLRLLPLIDLEKDFQIFHSRTKRGFNRYLTRLLELLLHR